MLLLAVAALSLTACVTEVPGGATWGVQPEHLGYVPARIAILPCTIWPAGASYDSLPLSNAKATDLTALCDGLDNAVIAGFENQPFMKGYPPKVVLKHLSEAKTPFTPTSISEMWMHQSGDCRVCTTPPAFYKSSLAMRPLWLAWLNGLAKDAHNVDAALLPFVTYAYERRYEDRGMAVAERGAGVALLLVDTNNGSLLWAGGREASLPNKRLTGGQVPSTLAYPAWTDLMPRLYAASLWQDFPGRQNN